MIIVDEPFYSKHNSKEDSNEDDESESKFQRASFGYHGDTFAEVNMGTGLELEQEQEYEDIC